VGDAAHRHLARDRARERRVLVVTSSTFTTTDTLVVAVFLGSTNCNTAFPITSMVWVSTPSGASTFTKRIGTNTPAGWQGAEIWTATTPSGTSSASVTATEACNQGMQDINVYSVTGQNASPIGVTCHSESDTSAAVQCTATTTAGSAMVVGWGQSNDATVLTALANTSLQDSLSTAGGYDASGIVSTTGGGGNITVGSSVSTASPRLSRWNSWRPRRLLARRRVP
jgi:hypothetical protein